MTLLFGVLIWIPLVVWMVSLIHWMIQGDMDGATGFMGLIIAGLMGYFSFAPPYPWIPPVFFGIVCVITMFYPSYKNFLDKRALLKIDIEQMEKAYDQLKDRQDNIGARVKLARLLFPRGLGGHSIVMVEQALAIMPVGLFEEEQKQVDQWKRQLGNPKVYRAIPCLECGIPNEAGRIYCKRCNAPYLLDHAKGRFLGPNLARSFLAVCGVAVMVILGIPWSMHHITGVKQMIAIFGQVALCAGVLWTVFVPRGKSKK